LYEIPPVAESEVRLIFPENARKSLAERAPVVVPFARAREIPVPVMERPFGVPETKPIFPLKVVQSVPVSTPVELALAFPIENTPVKLLYESGQFAERAVSPILVATTPESEVRLELVVARFPERVAMLPVAVARFALVVARFALLLQGFLKGLQCCL